ncbi:depupylase/deamidase Dop [Isoptericola sp. b441]|uniref:Depupylase/deamidase Dop n=1 Tax=Actinotalea lenta TaxID=3064654 RepID=A0ABT9DBJ6_9CELL|nr:MULTISPECIES: depupylase/deamidase Dop [unclassified Isoptericola]MDO8107558.1 depupylase/deamidase Dop [Isoptericola sp. b441]MDO8120782.1 depupylase/deamidase Dop [Isoptericola sp. b490]
MSVRRVMGIETEYGVLQPGRPQANPMVLSSHVVSVYAAVHARSRARWDYADEDPLADARGFRLARAAAHPSMVTDDPERPAPSGDEETLGASAMERPTVEEYDDPGAATSILSNGARLYVDHAHPEYSSPEVTTPLDAVVWDKAGERVMLAAARACADSPALPDVVLYKNNVDGKGASYGTHENYLVDRALPFPVLAAQLMPFLATRQVFAGAGRVGLGPNGQRPGFQISQRADYIEAEVGLETTLRRPIVNTRDEPHADRARWRRLHLILGDATMLEVATWLRVGTTSLVLSVLEQAGPEGVPELAALALEDPVDAVHRISHDPGLTARVELVDGRRLTALEIQQEVLAVVRGRLSDPEADEVLDRWASVLDRLGRDPGLCAREVEWVAKLRLLEGMARRDHLAWDNPRLAAMDFQWSDVRPERGLYHRLVAAGAVERLTTDAQVERAVHEPPADTRAYFRGTVVRRFADAVRAASWDSVVLDVPSSPTLQRIPLRDPWRGTQAHVGELLRSCPDAEALVARLVPR